MCEMKKLGYVVVTDFVEANAGRDVSDELQKIILDNPNKTIYFPDGEYLISKPICTPGNPKHAVSLELSTFAVIRATENWSEDEALVRMGAAEPYNDIYTPGSNYYFTGGILDGSGKANGISIDSGRETCIHHVSIKNTRVGIHIKWGANNRSSDADVHSVNIVGNDAKDSIGVWLVGHDNTLTNMRIASVHTGILAESGGNIFRNLHPLYIYKGENEKIENFLTSVAFDDRWMLLRVTSEASRTRVLRSLSTLILSQANSSGTATSRFHSTAIPSRLSAEQQLPASWVTVSGATWSAYLRSESLSTTSTVM